MLNKRWGYFGGSLDFKWQWWKDFLWVAKFFWVNSISVGIFWVFKTTLRFVIVPTYPSHLVPWIHCYGSKIRHGIFVGLNFGWEIFLGFAGSYRFFFFRFWFLPPFNHPYHLKSGVPPTPGYLGSLCISLKPANMWEMFFLVLFWKWSLGKWTVQKQHLKKVKEKSSGSWFMTILLLNFIVSFQSYKKKLHRYITAIHLMTIITTLHHANFLN